MLKFNVKNQIITREDSFHVVADSRNYLQASFDFSEEWQGEIMANFGFCGEFYSVILEDGRCTVPWEVIKAPSFAVSVVCGDRITSNMAYVEVELSGYFEGQTPKEPTPDVYQRILNSAKPPHIGENGNWYVWQNEEEEYADTGVCATGNNGYTPKRGIDYWTDDDKAEIEDYVDAVIGGIQPLLEEI